MKRYAPIRSIVMTLLAAIVIHDPSIGQSLPAARTFPVVNTYVTPQAAPSGFLSLQDSLELTLLDIATRKAEQDVSQTTIWHRIMPRVSVSASLGANDILFVDPASSHPYMLPRDAYRLTFTLSLSDILDDSRHAQALYELARLKTLRVSMLDRQEKIRELQAKKRSASEQEVLLLNEELSMIADIVRFRQLLFDQGKLNFDLLVRSKIELINTVKALNRLSLQQSEIMLNSP